MQAHIIIVYAVLATTSNQSVLHLLVSSLCTSLWRLVMPIALGHHSLLPCIYHALGSDWTHLVLLHVYLQLLYVNGQCQVHFDANIAMTMAPSH